VLYCANLDENCTFVDDYVSLLTSRRQSFAAFLAFLFAACSHHRYTSDVVFVVFVGSSVFVGRSCELLYGTNAIFGLAQCVNVHHVFMCIFYDHPCVFVPHQTALHCRSEL
jgi:hypothetical protein